MSQRTRAMRRCRRIAALVGVLTVVLGPTVAGCGSTAAPATPSASLTTGAPTVARAAGRAPCAAARAPARYDHVIWIWFENKAPVVGASSAPHFTALARQCGLATNYHAVTHPSLPNYLAATGGSTFGVTDDAGPAAHHITGGSIFGQVRAAGRPWRSYQESMPGRCALSSSGRYGVKHNPAAYFTRIRTDCAAWDVPMGSTSSGAFLTDLGRGAVGAFAFVTPNLCNDMHDCSVRTGDAWLKAWMDKILASPTYRAGRTAVVVTFDENDGAAGNRVSTIVVAPSVPPGTRSAAAFTHYSLLRTTEEMLGLPLLGGARTAPSMRTAFHL